jgi:hypothetical protein
MSGEEYKGKERRESPCGDNCVKDDFSTVKKLVFVILISCVLSGGLGGWAAFAANAKDSEQDSRITAVETNQAVILKNQDEQKQLTQQLIQLSTQTNLLVQTHIARGID